MVDTSGRRLHPNKISTGYTPQNIAQVWPEGKTKTQIKAILFTRPHMPLLSCVSLGRVRRGKTEMDLYIVYTPESYNQTSEMFIDLPRRETLCSYC